MFFTGIGLQHNQNLMDRFFKIEGFRVQTHFVGLNFGIIKDIIDDHQKCFARGLNGLHIKPLFIIQNGIGHQISHADNPVHGCSNLMAHIGKKG